MSNVIRYKLVQRVRIRRGVSDKALVVIFMVPSKLHFRIEREIVSVFFKGLHVVDEYIIRTISLWQDVGEQAVSHANTKKPFDLSFGRGRSILPETLKRRQEKYAASGFQHIATFHNTTAWNLLLEGDPVPPLWTGAQDQKGNGLCS